MRKHHNARYPYLWYPTTEEERIIRENRAQFEESVEFFSWDICAGFRKLVRQSETDPWVWSNTDANLVDPQKALAHVPKLPEDCVIFMKDYHKYFDSIKVVRQALNIKQDLKGGGRTVVFLAPVNLVPIELMDEITVMEFNYPDREALRKIMDVVAEDQGMKQPENPSEVLDALMGLTQEAAENALCLSYVEHGSFIPKTILNEKAAFLRAGGVLEYGQFQETFENLYGLDVMKKFVLQTIKHPEARGILIYGVPGCGKSHFAKALGNAIERAVLTAKFNALRDKYQGVAEARTSMMFKTIEAFGRPIVFADEIDKSLSGTDNADTDSGVGQRILGEFLTYMEDRREGGSYWICTCNNLEEFLTLSGGALPGRFDAIFFVDMPNQEEARGISKIWSNLKKVQIPEDFDFNGQFTGRDIKKLAKQMKMMECSAEEASELIIPYGKYNAEKLEEIRAKAEESCIWATSREDRKAPKLKHRKVKRDATAITADNVPESRKAAKKKTSPEGRNLGFERKDLH